MTKVSQNELVAFSPSFDRPPVVETALSVQFTDLQWEAIHLGLYYETIRQKYPEFRQEASLAPIVEPFPLAGKHVQVEFLNRPDAGRGLFTAPGGGASLIQIQKNRFGFNWRRESEDSPYPRFAKNFGTFLEEFRSFTDFCKSEGLGEVSPTFCEVVYVNHIHPVGEESVTEVFDSVFSGLSLTGKKKYLPNPENTFFNRTFILGDKQGRLYVEASVATKEERKQFVNLKLTSRLRHSEGDVAKSMLDCHDWLVKGFVDLTLKTCRVERWGQSNDE